MVPASGPARVLTRRPDGGRRPWRRSWRRAAWFRRTLGITKGLLGPLALLCLLALVGCATFRGPVTPLGSVEEFPAVAWAPTPAASAVAADNGVYLIPSYHLILVHILITNTSLATLGPDAVHGAVGVWWVALDDRAPGGGQVTYDPACVGFVDASTGARFDIAGGYLSGAATGSLGRYPLLFNPEDASISAGLSRADEIAVPAHQANGAPMTYLPPAPGVSCGGR